MVGNVEALVDPDNNIGQDDDNLDGEIEDIKARLRLVTGWVADWTGATSIICPRAVAGPKAEQECRGKQDSNLHPESAMSKFLQSRLSRYENPTDDQRDGEEGDDGVEGLAVKHDGTIYAICIFVEAEEALDGCRDEHYQTDHDEDVCRYEGPVEGGMPARTWMTRSHYPLSEQKVDDEEQDHSSGNEDVGRDSYADVLRSCSPDDAHDHGGDASHAETEHHAGDVEFVASSLVDLEDRHVADGADKEEDEEDCADGEIESNGGKAAQACGCRWEGTFRVVLAHRRTLRWSIGVLHVELAGEKGLDHRGDLWTYLSRRQECSHLGKSVGVQLHGP